jgi:hypothetical protein
MQQRSTKIFSEWITGTTFNHKHKTIHHTNNNDDNNTSHNIRNTLIYTPKSNTARKPQHLTNSNTTRNTHHDLTANTTHKTNHNTNHNNNYDTNDTPNRNTNHNIISNTTRNSKRNTNHRTNHTANLTTKIPTNSYTQSHKITHAKTHTVTQPRTHPKLYAEALSYVRTHLETLHILIFILMHDFWTKNVLSAISAQSQPHSLCQKWPISILCTVSVTPPVPKMAYFDPLHSLMHILCTKNGLFRSSAHNHHQNMPTGVLCTFTRSSSRSILIAFPRFPLYALTHNGIWPNHAP